MKDVNVILVLGYLKGRLYVPTIGGFRQVVSVNRHRKASFAVHKPDDPPRIHRYEFGFLLIVRTGRIVTAHALNIGLAYDGSVGEYRRILGGSSI